MPTATGKFGNRKYTKQPNAPETDSYGHLQPQAVELEQAVLGALMIEKDAYFQVSEILRPESFYDKRHQTIFNAIRRLNLEERPVDILTVTEQLRSTNELEEVGGPYYITQLSGMVASSAHIEYHARIIAQKATARELITYTSFIQTKAFDATQDVDGMSGIPSGFYSLDKITSGWQNSDLVILAARPAMGKTAFALSMAKNMAVDQKIPVALFSLEMSNVQLVNRLIVNVCEIKGETLKSGQLKPYEWSQLDFRIKQLVGAPLYVDDTPSLSVFELRTKARRLVREHGVKVLMIDYLQLMNASGMSFGSRQEEVSTISRSLKGLAKELNIPILALSQLNRGVENREGSDKRPQLSDLRESGAIEQDADMVLFIHRPEYYKIYQDESGNDLRGKAEIIIAKHRNGAVGNVLLTFRGEFARFQNPEDDALKNSLGNPADAPNGGNGGAIISSHTSGDDSLPPEGLTNNYPATPPPFGSDDMLMPPPDISAPPF